MRPLLFAILLLPSAATAGDCPARNGVLREDAESAEQALAQLDGEAFLARMGVLADHLACAKEPLTPVLAGRLHRAFAVLAFTHGDEQRTHDALVAAHAADPAGGFSPGSLPDGHPLYAELATAAYHGASTPIPRPAHAQLWFDGEPLAERPTGRSTIAQLVDRDGSVAFSAYLRPADPLPSYEVAAKSGKRRRGLAPVAVISGLSSAALFAGASASRQHFDAYQHGPDFSIDTLRRQQDLTNGLVVGGGVAAGVATITGTIALGGVF